MTAVLFRGGEVYAPAFTGKKDILVTGTSIESLSEPVEHFADDLKKVFPKARILDVKGCLLVPGFIDLHVHFEGAGGEGGNRFRTPPLAIEDFIRAGTTGAVGLLGTDCIGRSLKGLLAKARGLEEEGLSTWIYTGGYRLPGPTVTGSIAEDICLIDKIIGLKFAVAERNGGPYPSTETLCRSVADARAGGLLSGKSGLVHVHMGSGKDGFRSLLDVVEQTDIPITQFLPTHVARLEAMMEPSVRFARMGGNLDVTAFEDSTSPDAPNDRSAVDSVRYLLEAGVDPACITLSSDGNGSLPQFDSGGNFLRMCRSPVGSMMACFRSMVLSGAASMEIALSMCTANVAQRLQLPAKGRLVPGGDADLLVLNREDLSLRHVMAKGRLLMEDGNPLVKSTFGE